MISVSGTTQIQQFRHAAVVIQVNVFYKPMPMNFVMSNEKSYDTIDWILFIQIAYTK